ncbi:glycosyl hydrolase family 28-related protein [Glacieibacterium sp.]|uniref:glycosyl hydrolase family 28-related protein n=1 Tax=Glacieibacterium sp. TaxID=2860237 RepID=UPI003B000001
MAAPVILASPFLTATPLASATFYLAGTLTLATVYADKAGTPLANPVRANSAGVFPAIFRDPAVKYRLRITDHAGVQIRPDIDTLGGELAADAAALAYTAPGTDAVERTVAAKLGESISVKDFGAKVDGLSDDTAAAQAAYTATAIATGTEYFTAGTIVQATDMTSRAVHLRGAGRDASIIKPATANGVALRARYNAPSWDAVTISDMSITGAGILQGTGFRAGSDTKLPSEEYAGRTIITNVQFNNLNKSIERPFGQIGQWVDVCQFTAANYHLWTSDNDAGGDAMHGGNSIVTRSHFDSAALVSDYIRSDTVGTGQIVRRDNICESNPGWIHYWDSINDFGGVPGAVIENEWNEANYTAGSVTIGGATSAPGWGWFNGVASLRIVDTPLGPLTLAQSNVTTRDCALDNLAAINTDAASTLFHDNARMFAGHALGTVRSIGAVQNPAGLNGPAYSMPKPKGLFPFTANILALYDGQLPIPFTGTVNVSTTTSTGDPGLPFLLNTQDLGIATGQTLLPTATFTIPATSYFVLQYVAKLVSGPRVLVRVNGSSGIGGGLVLNNAEYKTMTVVGYNPGAAAGNESVYHTAGASTSIIRIAGLAVLSFPTAQAALEYANNGLFPAFDRPAYTLNNVAASRTLDPTTATLPQTAQALATLIADLKLGRLPK